MTDTTWMNWKAGFIRSLIFSHDRSRPRSCQIFSRRENQFRNAPKPTHRPSQSHHPPVPGAASFRGQRIPVPIRSIAGLAPGAHGGFGQMFFQKENIAILSCRMKDVHNHITFILYSTSPICICRSLFRKDYHEIKEGLYRLASLYAFQRLTETPPKLPWSTSNRQLSTVNRRSMVLSRGSARPFVRHRWEKQHRFWMIFSLKTTVFHVEVNLEQKNSDHTRWSWCSLQNTTCLVLLVFSLTEAFLSWDSISLHIQAPKIWYFTRIVRLGNLTSNSLNRFWDVFGHMF